MTSTVAMLLGLAVLLMGGGCGAKPADRRHDFSKAKSVSIGLGDPAHESGAGLQHLYHEKDGLTEAIVLDGVPCRALRLQDLEVGYVYFAIVDSFKANGVKKAKIEIEYLDLGHGYLGLQYDATGRKRVPDAAYADIGYTRRMGDSREWKRTFFVVRNAAFKNSQNSRSDFRFIVKPPELYLRRVSVSRMD